MRVQPGGQPLGLDHPAAHLEAFLGLGLGCAQRGEKPVSQYPELQLVEQPVHRVAVPRFELQVGGLLGHLDIPDQLGEPAVEQHRGKVLPQRVTGLAPDLVHPVDQSLQRAELSHPLRCGLLAHPRDTRQVVGGITAQGCVVRVLLRGQAVARHDLRGGEPGQVRDPFARVEHRHLIADQLQGVPIPGADQHLEARRLGPGHQGGDEVVGFVILFGEHGDAQGGEHVMDQRHLTAELIGCRAAVGLVERVGLRTEGLARDVERCGDVAGLLVTEQIDQHRGEAVDRIGGLPCRRAEILRGQGEERPVGQRVAIEQEQPRRGNRHGPRV